MSFVIYADFESINDSTLLTFHDEVNPERSAIKTRRIKHQSAASVGALIKSDHEEIIPAQYFSYRGEDVVDVFCNFLMQIEDFFSQVLETNIKMEITAEEEHSFQSALNCYYCGYELFGDKVRDHDHLIREYRGAAHNQCNLLARKYHLFLYSFIIYPTAMPIYSLIH
jgi:hypothetical protein